MAKIRSSAHLQVALDHEIGWRLTEISSLRSAAYATTGPKQSAIARSGVLISYSHWEGFVKKSAHYFGTYVSSQSLYYKDLKPCFCGLGVAQMVQNLGETKRKLFTASNVFQNVLTFEASRVNIKLWPVIEEVGNLTFSTFTEIAQFLGLDVTKYETKKNFIDVSLLNIRNKIAHGERIDIELSEMDSIVSEVIGLIRSFKTDIENSVTSKEYLRPATQLASTGD